VLRIFFTEGGQKVDDIKDFNTLWREIKEFKERNKARESPDFIGLQGDSGRMLLLTLYDEDRWVLETMEEDWATQFGNIDMAKDFEVREALLNDEELKKTLRRFMIGESLRL